MTDKEYIAYLVKMMSEQQYPCNICEIGWRAIPSMVVVMRQSDGE